MATPQLSPGVLVREVDLTVGRADNVLDNIGAIAGPFALGPVEDPIDITTENELINVFGKPISTDAQYDIANYIFAAKNPGSWSNNLKVCVIDDKADQILTVGAAVTANASIGMGVTTTLTNVASAGVGTTSSFNGYLKSIVTGIGASTLEVKITSIVSTAGVETPINYAPQSRLQSFKASTGGGSLTVYLIDSSGNDVDSASINTGSSPIRDWYDEQILTLSNTAIYWSSIAPKPGTSQYAVNRNGKSDEIHIVIVDDTGTVTGIQGNLLEKHIGLSKAFDAISAVNSPQKIWWKNYLAQYSSYVYVGDNPSDELNVNEPVVATGFSEAFTEFTNSQGLWNKDAQDRTYSALGNVTYNLSGGKDYSGSSGMTATLGDLFTAYNLFSNKDEIEVDYLIMGPGLGNKFESQAKANHLISIANGRKDCVAVISPHRTDVVDITNTDTQTDNIIEFFSPLSSSSYAVFDSGYKYTYDRFNNKFRYIPCNGDVAGLMVRTSILAYPWFSPAGQQRGILNNNDEITRANFRNIVEPYLRDVQAKRGLYGFLVVCDSSNNTPDVIDNNEFRADIYLKPAKSINYITLTFVAVRTGVSFEEVVGTV